MSADDIFPFHGSSEHIWERNISINPPIL